MISFIIPTRNNLPYIKLAYGSIRKFYPEEEIIILDDNSTDGTREWAGEPNRDQNTIYYYNDDRQVGHTVLYDKGVELAGNEIFTIFHADMVCGPNYVENLMKWLKPKGVVAATRIEPPLHPEGKEKIVRDFGTYVEDFKETDFYAFCKQMQGNPKCKGITTRGIFAPWMMYKADFLAIGGHDKLFSPFPYEDSDIFQRFILAGYEINQSRDAFVYHFTCRGHRWTKKVKEDDLFYKLCCAKNTTHFIRKWGSWIENDENCYPIIKKKYNIGFKVLNCPLTLIGNLEPWCSTIYCDNAENYINQVQSGTPFDMKNRVKNISVEPTNDIVVTFDAKVLSNESFSFLTPLPKVLADSGEVGEMEYDVFKIFIKNLTPYEEFLIHNNSIYYQNQLLPTQIGDPYCINALFDIYERVKNKV